MFNMHLSCQLFIAIPHRSFIVASRVAFCLIQIVLQYFNMLLYIRNIYSETKSNVSLINTYSIKFQYPLRRFPTG